MSAEKIETKPGLVVTEEVQAPIIDTRSGVSLEELQLLEQTIAAPAYGESDAEEERQRYILSRYYEWLNEERRSVREEDEKKYPPRPGDIIPLQAKLEQERPWLKRIIGSFATNAY